MDVTEETFAATVLERSHEVPVIVDFWAEWCGPCRALGPVLEGEIGAREGLVELAKVDVDANPQLADQYAVRGIPAVKAFRGGRVVAEFVGAQSRPSVSSFLDGLLGPTQLERVIEDLRTTGDEPQVLAALERGQHELALDLLLAEARASEGERRERMRELMVAVFVELGQEHPLATRYRKELATTLY